MPAFTEALDELRDRLSAIGVEGAGITTTYANPEEIQRALLSGYVPTEDADQAIVFTRECGDALLAMVGQAGSSRAIKAGLGTTVAQILALGIMIGRKGEG